MSILPGLGGLLVPKIIPPGFVGGIQTDWLSANSQSLLMDYPVGCQIGDLIIAMASCGSAAGISFPGQFVGLVPGITGTSQWKMAWGTYQGGATFNVSFSLSTPARWGWALAFRGQGSNPFISTNFNESAAPTVSAPLMGVSEKPGLLLNVAFDYDNNSTADLVASITPAGYVLLYSVAVGLYHWVLVYAMQPAPGTQNVAGCSFQKSSLPQVVASSIYLRGKP